MTWLRRAVGLALAATSAIATATGSGSDLPGIVAGFDRFPLAFEANLGQADDRVAFLTRGRGFRLDLERSEAVLHLDAPGPDRSSKPALRMRLIGANPGSRPAGADRLPGVSHYYVGDDPAHWHAGIPHYAAVRYAAIYSGIDLVFYGDGRRLEYDFVVAPGADARAIVLEFGGARRLSIDAEGNLVLATDAGDVVQHRPVVYQDAGGLREPVDGRYRLLDARRVGFELARYDTARPLVIDPTIAYVAYVEGLGIARGNAVAIDGRGNAHVTGQTAGNALEPPRVFVAKLDARGTLIYATYFAGVATGTALGIAVDAAANAYVTGFSSGGFPTTPGAYQRTFGGGTDTFVAKLTASGTLAYATYLGGPGNEAGTGIAVDDAGTAHVTGIACVGVATTPGFPTTSDAYQPVFGGGSCDAFVTKLDAHGGSLAYSTYLGGSGDDYAHGIALDGTGSAYVAGHNFGGGFPATVGAFQTSYGGGFGDAFVAKLNAAGTALLYATYLGGPDNDVANGIAVDRAGSAYVAGITDGVFPTTPDAFQRTSGGRRDGFVARLNAAGSDLVYSTYLGGPLGDAVEGIAVDARGDAYLTGQSAGGFPTTPDAIVPSDGRGPFFAKLDPPGRLLLHSTVFPPSVLEDGSDGAGIALDAHNAYLTGGARVPGTPLQSKAAYVMKLADVVATSIEVPAIGDVALAIVVALLAVSGAVLLERRNAG